MPVSVWRGLPSLLLLLASACGDGEISASAPSPTSSPASASVASLELAPRGQVLAEANRLSAQAAKDPGRAGAAASLQAARLRERMWRLEHREADALEALALYDEVAGRDSALACQAQVDAARLRGEAKNEPLVAYSGAYLARGKSDNAQCIARAELLIQALSAFRPGQSEIAALDREIQASRGSRAAAVGSVQDPQLASPAPVMPVVDPVHSLPPPRGCPARLGSLDPRRRSRTVQAGKRTRPGSTVPPGRCTEHCRSCRGRGRPLNTPPEARSWLLRGAAPRRLAPDMPARCPYRPPRHTGQAPPKHPPPGVRGATSAL